MPELPEVETVKESLKLRLNGRKIMSASVLWDNIIAYPEKELFIKNIGNQTINDIKRRGKFLVFDLDDYYLLSHLRMEGKYFFKKSSDEIIKHEYVIFKLDNGEELRYMDTRKFGKMYLIKKENINDIGPLKDLGLEPWDYNLNSKYLLDKYRDYINIINRPYVMGKDLIELGYKPGDYFNETLKYGQELRLKGIDKKEALNKVINYIEKIK